MQKSIFSQKIQKSLCITTKTCTQIQNFKRNYLKNYNDSEHAVKTKNAPFFMIFPNISFFHMIVTYWTGSLKCSSSEKSPHRSHFCKYSIQIAKAEKLWYDPTPYKTNG